jgi:protein-tyrosine phosphatase
LLAGEYPGSPSDAQARVKLRRLLDADIRLFLDLTEEGEYNLRDYSHLLREEAEAEGCAVEHRRMPIADGGTPTPREMRQILDAIDGGLAEGKAVYVHCWGGIGRTGTVIGCYLARHGLSGEQALQRLAELRCRLPNAGARSPETEEQRSLVRSWQPGQ